MLFKNFKSLWANKKGHSLVEMLLVLLLLLIFGLTAFSLIFTGSNTYTKLIANKGNSSDARIISSVLNTRLRQYDNSGAISLATVSWRGKPVKAFVFVESVEEDILKTWLFWEDNCLWEALTLNDEEITPDLAQELLRNPDLEVSFLGENKRLLWEISYPFSKNRQTLAASYTPRAFH